MDRARKRKDKQAVVELLKKKLTVQKKDVPTREGRTRKDIEFLVYECPALERCIHHSGPHIFFEKGKGFTNTCIANSNETELEKLFGVALENKREHGISFGPTSTLLQTPTQRERAMYAYMRFIVCKTRPISYVEDPDVRAFCGFEDRFSRKTFKETMFKVVELVEKAIGKEMLDTKGAILYDGWTTNATHYIGIFAVYCREVQVVELGILKHRNVVCSPLLSVSPMAKPDSTLGEEEAECFHAEVHVHHFRDIFPYYGASLLDWALCQIADNCSTNKKVASKLGIPHVGCMSHKMHLEMRQMIDGDAILRNLLDEIGETMRQCKSRLKNRAILRNLSALSPILPNETRWSGNYRMLKRFIELREELIQVAQTEGAKLRMNTSTHFRNKALKYERMLAEMNDVTLMLQKGEATLSDCRLVVRELVRTVAQYKGNAESQFHDCHMQSKYLLPDADIVKDPHFENGVCKIQHNQAHQLDEDEKEAVKCMLIGSIEDDTPEETHAEARVAERIALKRRKLSNSSGKYRDCSFVLGSVPVAERLWSICDRILPDYRKEMSPIVFEALLYLSVNKEYWDEQTVKEAMRTNRSESIARRLEEDDAMNE